MKRISLILLSLILIGAGCSDDPEVQQNRRVAWEDVNGISLIVEAKSQDGTSVVVYKPSLGRRFRSKIASTFTDFNGSYTMSDSSSVEVQLGVQGTPEEDRAKFKKLANLSSFEDGELNSWMLTIGYDTNDSRWVLRAAQKDLGFEEDAYHVIECLAVEKSDFVFWDGCRTVIENAQLVADAK